MPARSASDLDAWLEAARAWADEQLERHFVPATEPLSAGAQAGAQAGDRVLAEAMRYAVLGGGKRLRPSLVRLTGEALGAPPEDLELPAVAVELIHAYSLVHDDLPCMDDDELRRGRPTCHIKFGEAQAVLAGDALQTKAFELLATGPAELAVDWIGVLARASGDAGMVGGQAVDMTLPRGAAAEAIQAMHARKTAALIGAAAELGAVSARAGESVRAATRRWGRSLGLLFQATDDLLDVTGDTATLGKTTGTDDRNERPTLVATLGLEGTRREADRLVAEANGVALELGWTGRHPALLLVERVRGRSS